jgi:O-antigen/teichoic acid export membrane protein
LTILFVVGLGQGATGSLTAQLIAAIIAALVAFNYFRRDFSLQFSRRHLLESLQFGLPLMPHILSGWLTSYIDRIALSRYKALADVGIYSVGLSISTIMLFWVASLIQAWNPFFFKTLEAEGTAAHPKLVQATTLMVLIFLLPAFTLAAFAKEIVFVMAAPSFHAAYAIVPVLTLYYFIGGLNNLVVAKLYFVNATAWVSLSTFISLAVAVGANILLVPQYGMPGAAIASVASSLVVTGLNWAKSQRLYPMQYEYWQITKAMGLSLALFAFSFLIPNLGLALTIGIKLFGTVLLGMGFIFLGALNKSEIELIKLVIRKALTRVPPFKAEDTL